MTTKKVPRICDFQIAKQCEGDILTEQQYKFQVSIRGGKRGEFTKASMDADCCHYCFLAICKTGYMPKWVTTYQDQETKKWLVKPLQAEGEKLLFSQNTASATGATV